MGCRLKARNRWLCSANQGNSNVWNVNTDGNSNNNNSPTNSNYVRPDRTTRNIGSFLDARRRCPELTSVIVQGAESLTERLNNSVVMGLAFELVPLLTPRTFLLWTTS